MPFLGGTQGTKLCQAGQQFSCLQQNVINLTKLNCNMAYLLHSRYALDGQPRNTRIICSLWEWASRPKQKRPKIKDFTSLFHINLGGWFFPCIVLFFLLRDQITCPHLFSLSPLILGGQFPLRILVWQARWAGAEWHRNIFKGIALQMQ